MAINPFSFAPFMSVAQSRASTDPFKVLREGEVRRKEFAQRQLENTQQNDRANWAMRMQQAYQDRRFSKGDQAELEGLIAEFQAAEDQGDPANYDRIRQKLQRYGLDVGDANQGASSASPKFSPPANDLSQEEFERQLTQGVPDEQSPEQFEEQLVAGGQGVLEPGAESGSADRYDDIVRHLKGRPVSPRLSTQPLPGAQAEQPAAEPSVTRPLVTQPLRADVVRKNGKAIYAANPDSVGRSFDVVASVFEPFIKSPDPEVAQLAKEAATYGGQLTTVDGIPQAQAVKAATDFFEKRLLQLNNLRRTQIGSRPKFGGGGGAVAGAFGKEGAALADDADKLMLAITSKPEYQKVQQMDGILIGAEEALNSGDPLRQQQAISDIMRARSGLTVRKDEEASLRNASGLWEGLKSKLGQSAGYGLSADYRRALSNAIATQRAINQRIQNRIADETRTYYEATRGAPGDSPARSERINRNADAINRMLRRGGGAESSDSDDPFSGY